MKLSAEGDADLFSLVSSDRMWGNDIKLHQRMFRFVIRNNLLLFSVRVVKHWNKLLKDVVMACCSRSVSTTLLGTCYNLYNVELGAGHDHCESLPAQNIQWFYVLLGKQLSSIFQWGFAYRYCAQLECNYLQPENSHMSKSASAAFIYNHLSCLCCGNLPCLFILLYSVSSVSL